MEENVCRICLQASDEEEMSSIYQNDEQGTQIANKIKSCCGVKLPQEDDGFPTKICSKCKVFLTIAYKLRTICKNSDAYLRRFKANVKDSEVEENDEIQLKEEVEDVTAKLKNTDENDDMETSFIEIQDEPEEEYTDSSNHVPSRSPKHGESEPKYPIQKKGSKNKKTNYFRKLKNTKDKPNKLQKAQENNDEKYTICPYCGGTYVKKSLSLHIRRHTGEKPYKCDMCESAFVEKYDLARHKRSHTGEKPHVCAVCGKAFAQQSKLSRHNLVHTGERPYKCELCTKTFTQRNELNLHMLRHTGAKPYSCGICGEAFLTGTILRNHQKSSSHFQEETEDRFIKIRVTNPSRSYRRAVKPTDG